MRDPIEDTNTLLVASARRSRPERLRSAVPELPPARWADRADAAAPRSRPPLEGGDVYTDDKAPVEWLIDKSIVDYAGRK